MHIKNISIKNFRSIENQTITDIDNALILIGKNNSGKSSVINSIRAFFGQYQIEAKDFSTNQEEIEIKIAFEIEDEYFQNYIFNQKIGILKFPSNATEFNSQKVGTSFSTNNFNDYKKFIEEAKSQLKEEINFQIEYPEIYNFWVNSLKEKFKIENNLLTVTASVGIDDIKNIKYCNSENCDVKTVTELFPELSYIHDERSFSEEENGKTNTLTYNLFINKILNKHRNSEVKCSDCENERCDECCHLIKEKPAIDLTIDELEKLTQRQLREISKEVSKTISDYFEENYKKDYKIKITPKCNINKSAASINTKILDPNIQKDLSISNVGAGLRNIYYLSLLQAYNELYGEDFSNNRKMIYLLEEPEIYLHPSLQKEMCSILYKISLSNQTFFTTHSPLLLKNFDSKQIRKLSLNPNFKTKISEASLSEILSDIGYSTTDLLQTEFVVICEGKDDKERLSLIIEKFYNLDTKKIFFLNAKGCTNIEAYATLEFLDKTELKDNFAIIRDSDTEDPETIKESLLRKYKENVEPEIFESVKNRVLVLKYSALECYFLNPDILYKLEIVGNNNEFNTILNDYVKDERNIIEKYIKERNKKNKARINQLIDEIYNTTDYINRIEIIKKNVRGHNLFELFNPQLREKINNYIEESTKEDFKEIIEFLNKLSYFKQKRRGTRTLVTRTLLDYDK